MGPKPVTYVFIEGTQKQRKKQGRRQIMKLRCHSQGMSRNLGNHQKQGGSKETFFIEPSERAWPYLYLDFGLLVSRTIREYISIVFKPPSL